MQTCRLHARRLLFYIKYHIYKMTSTASIQWNSKAIIGAVATGVAFLYVVYSLNKHPEIDRNVHMQSNSWKTGEFVAIPEEILKNAKNEKITERFLSFEFTDQGKKIAAKVYYRENNPKEVKKFPVLLLHGMAFNSNNWQTLGTTSLISAMGHHVVALDLPGFGKSTDMGRVTDKAAFLQEFIRQAQLDRPVVVSPSMSGSFSIPYLIGKDIGKTPDTCDQRMRGFVPVAPAGHDLYKDFQYHHCEIPAMIVYGTKDKSMGLQSVNSLRNLADNVIIPLEGAKHPAYLDQPEEWHKDMYNFLLAVEKA